MDQAVSASEFRNRKSSRSRDGDGNENESPKIPRQKGSNTESDQPDKDHLILPGQTIT
jgi:hypothetical protein